jgi:hypothetical protein
MTIRQQPRVSKPSNFTEMTELNKWLQQLFGAVDASSRGKMDCVTEITLTALAGTTVMADYRLSAQSVVIFDPTTANAAAELAAGTMYVLTANRGSQSWTITHANNAQTDRTYAIAIFG